MARSCMRLFLLLMLPIAITAGVAGCAAGFGGGDDDGNDPRIDARVTTVDAPVGNPTDARPVDAPSTTTDAPVSLPDASLSGDGGSGPFCNSTAECASMPGTCCFFLIQPPGFCVAGSEQFGVCFPS